MKNSRLVQHLLSMAITALFLLPLWWMFSASLRPQGLLPPPEFELLPQTPTLANYATIFEILPIGRYLINSLTVTASAVFITLITASWAGFGMSLLGARARLRLLVFSFIIQTIPVSAFWLTRFLLFTKIGLTNSHLALIVPAFMGSSSLFVLLFYWTFRRIDRSIFESAELDGAGPLQSWWHIAIPLARPAIMTVGLLAFLFYWNDFINPLLYLRSQTLYTLPIGLLQLQEMDKTNWSLLMAASVVMTIPALILFVLLHKSLASWYRAE